MALPLQLSRTMEAILFKKKPGAPSRLIPIRHPTLLLAVVEAVI